jgi:hypothetical protein
MAKLIKVSETSAYHISIIQMGDNEKGKPKKPKMLSIRKMYCTQKDKTWKPAYQGMTIPLDICARILKGMIAVYKDLDQVVEVIEPKKRGNDE